MIKWNYDACIAEAKKYEYKQDFKKNSGGAYNSAKSNGWLSRYTWLKTKIKPKNYWTREHCLEEAKKYKSYHDFHSSIAYQKAMNEGWLKDYSWFNDYPKETPSYETCRDEALKFQTLKDYRENGIYYNTASHKGYISSFEWLTKGCKPNGYWDENRCYEEAKKYHSRWEFEQNCPAAKYNAMKNGWIDNYTWFATPQKWDYDACYAEAQKYDNVWDFHNGSSGAYKRAYKQKWLYGFKWLFANSNHNSRNFKFNLLEEFVDEYHLRDFLMNNDENMIYIILRNIEPKYNPIVKDIDWVLHSDSNDPIKDLEDKYRKPEEEETKEGNTTTTFETETTAAPSIDGVDLDDDDAVEAFINNVPENEKKGDKKEPTIEDLTKARESEIKIINKIEHRLTPEERQFIKDKFLNDRRREWMLERDSKKVI